MVETMCKAVKLLYGIYHNDIYIDYNMKAINPVKCSSNSIDKIGYNGRIQARTPYHATNPPPTYAIPLQPRSYMVTHFQLTEFLKYGNLIFANFDYMEHITLHGTHANGRTAIVNNKDADWLNKYKWYAHKGHNGTVYARATVDGVKITMNRLILGLTDSHLLADHVNGDTLNNTRSNLRTATASQNARNRKPSPHKKYLGVGLHKSSGYWRARVVHNGRRYTITCRTEDEAALAYNTLAAKYHGEFARFNIVAPN